MRKILATVMALTMLLTMLAPSALAQEETNPWLKKYEPGITLTVHAVDNGSFKFLEGDSIIDNEYTRWVKEETGITFEAKWIAADDSSNDQRLNVAAAGNELPDVIFAEQKLLSKLADAGLLMDLNDLIDQYASPLTKYIIESNQEATKDLMYLPFMKDGKIFAFPQAQDSAGHWKTNWIRSDILRELGFEKPTTLAQFEEILAAYKKAYPDGVGFAVNKDLNGGGDLELVAAAYGVYPRAWVAGENGEIVYGSVQPGMKDVLATFARWYELGYLDPEFVVKDGGKVGEMFDAGNILSRKALWWEVFFFGDYLYKNVPGSEMEYFPALAGEDGTNKLAVTTVNTWGVAISKNCKNPEALVYLYNEEMDSLYRNADTELKVALHEAMDAQGYTFKYKPEPVQDPINPEETENYKKEFAYEQPGYGFFNKFETHDNLTYGFKGTIIQEKNNVFVNSSKAYVEGTNPDELDPPTRAQYNEWVGNNTMYMIAPNMVNWDKFERSDNLIPVMFLGASTPTMLERMGYLQTIETETFVNIIIGAQPLDDFDKFVADWYANGGTEIVKEVNAWYAETVGTAE